MYRKLAAIVITATVSGPALAANIAPDALVATSPSSSTNTYPPSAVNDEDLNTFWLGDARPVDPPEDIVTLTWSQAQRIDSVTFAIGSKPANQTTDEIYWAQAWSLKALDDQTSTYSVLASVDGWTVDGETSNLWTYDPVALLETTAIRLVITSPSEHAYNNNSRGYYDNRGRVYELTVQGSPVPEPGTAALGLLGVGLIALRRRRGA